MLWNKFLGKQKIAVVNFQKLDNRKSIIASNRIANYLIDGLGAFRIDRPERCLPVAFDAIIIVNGVSLYCDFREDLVRLCEKNKKFIWIANDYTLPVMSQIKFIKDREFWFLANFDNEKKFKNYGYVNWNKLTFVKDQPVKEKKYTGLAYYGAYREDREEYFKKYMRPGVRYDIYVSTGKKNTEKFKKINPAIKFFVVDDVIKQLGWFSDTIYIEDKTTHRLYNSPANRYYECLSAGTYIMFDRSCWNTFERAGIDVGKYMVDKPEDIWPVPFDHKMYYEALEEQRKDLYYGKDYRAELDCDVEKVLIPILKG